MMLRNVAFLLPITLTAVACGDASRPTQPDTRFLSIGPNQGTRFESFGASCSSEPPDVSVTDGVLHIRNLINHDYEVSSNPMVDGQLTVWVDVTMNTKSGGGSFGGYLELQSTTLPGSWVAHFAGHLKGGHFDADVLQLVDAHMVAHGTGAFEGMKLMFDHFFPIPSAVTIPASAPPGCVAGTGDYWRGVIVGSNN